MRGILPAPVLLLPFPGITPAHAGNTRSSIRTAGATGDHPRACGEYVVLEVAVLTFKGSPPRMRGIPFPVQGREQEPGITPAHAGNTHRCTPAWCRRWDHPRACGEYLNEDAKKLTFRGSPPRMRGIQLTARCWKLISGITPAHAGNTGGKSRWTPTTGDHPRACGEYLFRKPFDFLLVGSPPRMRGIPMQAACPVQLQRITPAHAGNTLKNPMI